MSEDLPPLFDLLLVNDISHVIKIELNLVEELMVDNICFKNDKNLSHSQKRLLLKDAKLSALTALNSKRNKYYNGKSFKGNHPFAFL
jgi:hypothetical protein